MHTDNRQRIRDAARALLDEIVALKTETTDPDTFDARATHAIREALYDAQIAVLTDALHPTNEEPAKQKDNAPPGFHVNTAGALSFE